MSERVYLDYAATAPLCDAAAAAMAPFMAADAAAVQYNANSLHAEGRASFTALEQAREIAARILGTRAHELYFTSGATESNNAVLFSCVARRLQKSQSTPPHIVTTSIEHDAIFQAAQQLESLGLARVTYVKPLASGHVEPDAIAAAMSDDTTLVSVMAVNNETSAVNDIAAIGELAHERGILFHSDMVQLLGKAPLNLAQLPVDAASFSAHKIGGPKGLGLLYLKAGTPFVPLLVGGGQEHGIRSGTQNVCAAVGFAAALEQYVGTAEDIEEQAVQMRELRDTLYERLCAFPAVRPTVPCERGSSAYAPHIVNVCVTGVESETMILQLDIAGCAVSGGSACSSHSLEPSRVLLELGIDRDTAFGSLRVSIGPETSRADIDYFCKAFEDMLRVASGE